METFEYEVMKELGEIKALCASNQAGHESNAILIQRVSDDLSTHQWQDWVRFAVIAPIAAALSIAVRRW
jgi:hypothetical protein